jgi:hypothetical protein
MYTVSDSKRNLLMPSETHYHITPSGFAHCEVCSRQIKGGTPEATERLMAAHLFHKHSISLHVDDGVNAPTVIPWDRRGNGMLTSMNIDRENSKLYTHGASNVKAYKYCGGKVVPSDY